MSVISFISSSITEAHRRHDCSPFCGHPESTDPAIRHLSFFSICILLANMCSIQSGSSEGVLCPTRASVITFLMVLLKNPSRLSIVVTACRLVSSWVSMVYIASCSAVSVVSGFQKLVKWFSIRRFSVSSTVTEYDPRGSIIL